ncbi:MAG: hypothetical protein IK092_00775 [Muribaculaceae bacterium]|nr:hypothetical protein [Muribaculaceae bacterium]
MFFIILWCVVAALTVGIYLLIFPVYGHLFGVNVGVALVAEALGIYAFSMVTSKEELTPQKASLRIILFGYAAAIILWTTISSLTLCGLNGPFVIIYCGLLVISLVAAIIYGLGVAGAKTVTKQESHTAQARDNKSVTLYPLDSWLQRLTSYLGNGNETQDLLSEAHVVVDTIKTIPSRKLLENSKFVNYINNHMQSIENLASMVNKNENSQGIMKQMLSSIGELKNNIKNFKNQ